ncbi:MULTISPECIES: hypothetical protein [Pseudomonas]|uniref:hypothetical protein n=1 Tax=Pseudomonas TaxID=286 RepID=UPI0013A7AF50|nr:hypothetical protein [Pseudomonas sp. OIL-1]QIB51075.1 hypothetical protein G3M63_08440 [Pseudomonas sp. OIL-1]
MAKKNLFLVSYILDNQPQTCEIESDAQTLTPEQALPLIKDKNPDIGTGNVTDVQVQHMVEPKEEGTTPSHHIQS